MGFSVSEAYSLPMNAKSLVESVMAKLCGSHYPLHMAMVEASSQRVLIDKAFSVPKRVYRQFSVPKKNIVSSWLRSDRRPPRDPC